MNEKKNDSCVRKEKFSKEKGAKKMSRMRKKGVWICVMLVAMLLTLCGGVRSGLCGGNGDAHHGNGFDDDDDDSGSSVERRLEVGTDGGWRHADASRFSYEGRSCNAVPACFNSRQGQRRHCA